MPGQNRPQPFRGESVAQDRLHPVPRNAESGAVPGIRLRAFRKQDLVQLHALDQVCFPQDIAYSIADLKYFLNSARCFSWVAEGPEAKVAAFTIVERARRQGKMTGHLVTLDVGPWMRRKGIGRLLLSVAETQLKREGAALLTLEVAEDNLGARAFYRRWGFADVGRISNYYAERLDARVMEKAI